MTRSTIQLDESLGSGEVGALVDVALTDACHPDGLVLSRDQWSELFRQRRAASRPLHLWEVPNHG